MSNIHKEILANDSHSWDGAPLPAYPTASPLITICRITLAPGAKLGKHLHPVINAGVVLSGTLSVIAEDGKQRDFGPGEAIIEMVNTIHYGENKGAEPVELIMFYAGTPASPLSIPKQ